MCSSVAVATTEKDPAIVPRQVEVTVVGGKVERIRGCGPLFRYTWRIAENIFASPTQMKCSRWCRRRVEVREEARLAGTRWIGDQYCRACLTYPNKGDDDFWHSRTAVYHA